ncbi:hypothetical protein FEM48_Zijuj02G0083400 [Ziziphus jujuba var. spinosa]|uniref:Uncharacterized protein n=1 Tax=Ziziphus jujuba var. spinosa TaxID=714518 RepID=A0A978VUN1_ZIZJJ|nr:hypothetical protein FEM48_Zijuj02G0083400 [Ziziphus jujuba var. spinosa]
MGVIINHSKLLENAREGIDRVVRKNRLVEESKDPSFPSKFSIYPSHHKGNTSIIPTGSFDQRKCVQACKIEKYLIPKNTFDISESLPMGRDPKCWRICPAKNLALQILSGLVAGLIYCFDWKVVERWSIGR